MVGWFNGSHFLLQVEVLVEPLDELLSRHVNLVVLFLLLQREGRVRDSHFPPNRTLHQRRTLHLVIAVQKLQHFLNARNVVVVGEPGSVFAAFDDVEGEGGGGAVAAAELVVTVGVNGVVVVALEVEDGFGGGEFAAVEVEVNGVFALGYAFSQYQEHDAYYVPELPRRRRLWAWAWAWAWLDFHCLRVVSGDWWVNGTTLLLCVGRYENEFVVEREVWAI